MAFRICDPKLIVFKNNSRISKSIYETNVNLHYIENYDMFQMGDITFY